MSEASIDPVDKPAPRRGRASRGILILVGLIALALGVIGAFVPLMPSTVFFIIAAACFARSSPRLEAWILSHAFIGEPVRAWRERGAISRRGKWLASAGMSLGFVLFLFAKPDLPVAFLVASVLAGCAGFIWSRPV